MSIIIIVPGGSGITGAQSQKRDAALLGRSHRSAMQHYWGALTGAWCGIIGVQRYVQRCVLIITLRYAQLFTVSMMSNSTVCPYMPNHSKCTAHHFECEKNVVLEVKCHP